MAAVPVVAHDGNVPKLLADTLANRPAANAVPTGTWFYAIDTDAVYRSDGTNWNGPVGGSGSGVDNFLAHTQVLPAGTGTTAYLTTSTSHEDVDAAFAVTFTVPSSGAVLVVLSSYMDSQSNEYSWNLRDGSGDIADTQGWVNATHDARVRITRRIRVEGLTPNDELTWKWGHARLSGTGNALIRVGGPAGAALMEVWAA